MSISYSRQRTREPFISKEFQAELWSYLGGICQNLESFPIIVGGHLDHVHILCLLSQKIALMKLLEEVKLIRQNGQKQRRAIEVILLAKWIRSFLGKSNGN